MNYTVLFSTDALSDYSDASDWYEMQSKGLEKKFESEMLNRIKFISLHPEASPYKFKHLRGTRLKKFPYYIYFELNETLQTATILAILHESRDSEIFEQRF